jgi:hypothetical protein
LLEVNEVKTVDVEDGTVEKLELRELESTLDDELARVALEQDLEVTDTETGIEPFGAALAALQLLFEEGLLEVTGGVATIELLFVAAVALALAIEGIVVEAVIGGLVRLYVCEKLPAPHHSLEFPRHRMLQLL